MKTIENDMLISMLTRKLQNSTEVKKKVFSLQIDFFGIFWNIWTYFYFHKPWSNLSSLQISFGYFNKQKGTRVYKF